MQRHRKEILGFASRVLMVFIGLTWLALASEGFVLSHCAYADMLTKDQAENIIAPKLEEIWEKADQRKGLRVLQHSQLLPKGTCVKPAFSTRDEEPSVLTCNNTCWLFFVDEAPGAHFAHPVVIILLDAETGEQQVMRANWWPCVYGPHVESKPIFSTLKERGDSDMIIFEKAPVPVSDPSSEVQYETFPWHQMYNAVTHQTDDACDAWAIIVCGYDDLPDTFDEDTDGMYDVLLNLGLSDDQIFFVSPHTTHSGVDRPTSVANVQWAINEVAAEADEGDKVLFFYSSHGNIDTLSCEGGGPISASNLDSWIDAITCEELTIIIEACHSGSLIGLYADGTYVPAEDELTGDGETNRVVFTSASTDTSSYPDVDGPDDPNPSDSGSESIWGYVEAFNTPTADTNSNGAISFGEGWQYAWDNDVTRIRGWNTPQMVHTGLDTDNVYHYCYPTCDANGPYVVDCQGAITTVALDGSGSNDPDPCETLTYDWTTDCPGVGFDDPTIAMPTLSVNSTAGCLQCNVSLTVTCNDGNSETCSTTVTIMDTTPPVLSGVPGNVTVECDSVPDPASPTATDNCDPSPTVNFSEVRTDGSCPSNYTLTRTWSATDGCGNETTATQIITVVDTTPPVISCNAPLSITPPDAPISFTATAIDNCDSDPFVEITGYDCFFFTKKGKRIDKTESCVVDVVGDTITILDSGGVGTRITWTVLSVDECGNSSQPDCMVEVIKKGKP